LLTRDRARSSLNNIPLAKLAFGAFVAINIVWLVMTMTTQRRPLRAEEAYGECRAAVRRMRPEAARLTFPTADLIRVARRDAVREVRGYYVPRPDGRQQRYVCDVTELPRGWKVDTIMFER